MGKIILDTSILIKLFHPEEHDTIAERLLLSFSRKNLSFVIPDIALYEFVNALRFSKKAHKTFILESLRVVLSLKPKIISYSNALMEKILEIMDKSMITVYDAAFVATAELEEAPLLTADYKHHNKKISSNILLYDEWKDHFDK